jgi:hypothetical protein
MKFPKSSKMWGKANKFYSKSSAIWGGALESGMGPYW